jgi:NIMA (never in mitosis gene a)-related kinase
MKKVKLMKLSTKEKENALNEIRILASVNHQNVIGYKEAYFDENTNELCIIMELANGGDLDGKITQAKNLKSFVKEEKIWHIVRHLIQGLVALHDQDIVHRDIKCANVFLSNDGGVKLGDMNVSKIAKVGIMQTQTGTPYYCPPEVWNDKPYNSKCDIWSLGCVIYELTSLKPPFLAKNMNDLFTKVQKGIFPPVPKHFSTNLANFI